MRELTLGKHRLRVHAGRMAHPGIEGETRRAGLRSGLIGKVQKLLFGFGIVVAERNVGRSCCGWLQSGALRGLAWGAIAPLRSSQQSSRWPNRVGAHHQHNHDHESKGSWHQLVPTQHDPGWESFSESNLLRLKLAAGATLEAGIQPEKLLSL